MRGAQQAEPTRDDTFVLAASFAQQRLWFLHQFAPQSPLYNIPFAFRLRGPVDTGALGLSLDEIVRRHETLRTTFALGNADLAQRIAPSGNWPMRSIDLRAHPSEERETRAGTLALEEARLPFELDRGPLIRALLLRLDEQEWLAVLVLHHIIADGWSLGILARELGDMYGWFSSRAAPAEEPPAIQYADFSAWQREWLQGDVLRDLKAYWREHLRSAPPHINLPSDHPRPPMESFRGDCILSDVGHDVVGALESLANEERATLFMVLLTAFATLLHGHCGEEDIVIGSPTANRNRIELEGLIGFFVNTLPLRVRLGGNPTFRALLGSVREMALGAFAHQDMPFEKIVELIRPDRDASRAPVFQVMLIHQNLGDRALVLRGLDTEPYPIHTGTSKFDLTLFAEPSANGLSFRLEFSTDLFSADRIRMMLERWGILLKGIASKPDSRLLDLPLLTPRERQQINSWACPTSNPPPELLAHEMFEAAARRHPGRTALSALGQQISYGELDRRANAIANHLRSKGAGPDTPVGLCAARSIEATIGILGILKAGAACLPLDPSYPGARLRQMIDSGHCHLILAPGDAGCLPPSAARIIRLDELPTDSSTQAPESGAGPGHIAYIIFTSGSTGEPKGVAMEHGPLANLVAWQTRRSKAAPKTLQFAPLGFDVSFQEMFSTWASGGELVLIPDSIRPDPPLLWRSVCEEQIERLFLPPVMLGLLAGAVSRGGPRAVALREVITAGEALKITPSIQSLFVAHPDAALENQYGPTETHVVTAFSLPRDPAAWPLLPPIGRPIDNAAVHILDAALRPVPIGAPGELWIGGPVLARGYWRRPDLTTERFVADPSSPDPGSRLYRTGDIGRFLPDGNIEFLGRNDHQLKIRGFRIEPEEIQAALAQCPGVQEVAIAATGEGAGRRLLAFVVPRDGAPRDAAAIRDHARRHLPEPMIPSACHFLDRLPLDTNGKVDRGALVALSPDQGSQAAPPNEPWNILEIQLLGIWQRLFGLTSINRDANFFDLGGHSLLAARMIADVEALIGHRVPVSALFQAPTIAALANVLSAENWAPAWNSLVPLQPSGDKPPFFFVHGWGGDVLGFVGLARLLAPDQPAYGLQAIGLDGRTPKHTSVEEMAAHYVREIQSFLPRGPYYIGGYSMGGVIAYEMARLLDRSGHRPGMVAMLDTHPICAVPWSLYLRLVVPYLIERFRHHRRTWATLRPGERRAFMRGRLRALAFFLFPRRADPVSLRAAASLETQNPRVAGFRDYYHAVATRYRPKPYAGKIHLFLSDSAKIQFASAWIHLARGGTVTHRVPGHHYQILDRDHVTDLARVFRAALEDAQRIAGDARPPT